MGLVKRKVTRQVPCDHFNSHGNFCKKCGARKLLLGVGYELGWIEVEEEIEEPCGHAGETGTQCSVCGDRLHPPVGS